MGLKDFLQSRRDDAELGKGVWRRAHDRFLRGIDRFHQVLERLAGTDMIELVVPSANELADLIPRVRAIAMEAHRIAPSMDTDIPYSPNGTFSDIHRALSRAGNAAALCAEALAMARCFGDCSSGCTRQVTVERRVQTVVEHVQEAEGLIARALQEQQDMELVS
ncbi:MAG: dehydrogenase [Rothia sp. (in: high G+C Gram-positive bacteria)]|uniref:dehydrogenase n=1 Tax=Rothia sp. (in: high G+C Gram-positive bacteria) TaxID=1885016 RepID=UPI0026DF2DA6|nr:dehydrogenase [Rothia sp. (in: high G+C Gram-positive bacteria)]MDO5749777.1 dehydrogenase [Rothia sp. (in: high G+C Gram-positive bacteria)]